MIYINISKFQKRKMRRFKGAGVVGFMVLVLYRRFYGAGVVGFRVLVL